MESESSESKGPLKRNGMTKHPNLHLISVRVTFWVSLIVISITAIHIYLIRPGKRFLEQKMYETDRIAHVIEAHLLAEMLAGEPRNIQNHLVLLPEKAGIRRVEITDPAMIVRFSSDTARVGRQLDRASDPPCRECHQRDEVPSRIVYELEGGDRVFAADHVLHNTGECRQCHEDQVEVLGNILVEISFAESDLQAMRAGRRLALIAGILLVALLIGLALIIHILVGRPTGRLLRKMNRVQVGDFDLGPPRRSKDEFGALDRGFHNMVSRLSDLYSEMEVRIKERTNKLYATQAQLMHQEKLAGIGQLAAGVAHEIGNPLTAVDSMVQLLAVESSDPKTKEVSQTILRQVDRISEIVHNMADLSRPLSLKTDLVNVNSVIYAVLSLARYDARFRSIEVRTRLDESISNVRTVEDRLFGAFLNFALNAADAMPEGGLLEITTARDAGTIVTSFRDTGEGIPRENLNRVFDAYFTTKGSGRGTGLGLSVCKTYIESMGGRIEVASEPGEGSVFSVRIPVQSGPEKREA